MNHPQILSVYAAGTENGQQYLVTEYVDGFTLRDWARREVSPDGRQVCFPVRRRGHTTASCTTADGTNPRELAQPVDVRGPFSWSPDGKWIAVTAGQFDGARLFKVPVDGGPPVRLVDTFASNPLWSPDGAFILYSGPQIGRNVPVKAVTPEGQPYPLPELWVYRTGENYRFQSGGQQLVLMQGGFRRQNFSLLDLKTGRQRQLTNLQPGSSLRSFDVSASRDDRISGASNLIVPAQITSRCIGLLEEQCRSNSGFAHSPAAPCWTRRRSWACPCAPSTFRI